jgi:hypothetical protein
VQQLFQVSKFLVEKSSTNTLHGQVTIGTLILQVWTPIEFFYIFTLIHGYETILSTMVMKHVLTNQVGNCLMFKW